MHVLITGANGFVGQALTNHILSQGRVGESKVSRLTLLDRQFDEPVVDRSSLDLVVEQQSGDLADDQWLKDTLGRFPMDVIYHLASIPGGMAEKMISSVVVSILMPP